MHHSDQESIPLRRPIVGLHPNHLVVSLPPFQWHQTDRDKTGAVIQSDGAGFVRSNTQPNVLNAFFRSQQISVFSASSIVLRGAHSPLKTSQTSNPLPTSAYPMWPIGRPAILMTNRIRLGVLTIFRAQRYVPSPVTSTSFRKARWLPSRHAAKESSKPGSPSIRSVTQTKAHDPPARTSPDSFAWAMDAWIARSREGMAIEFGPD